MIEKIFNHRYMGENQLERGISENAFIDALRQNGWNVVKTNDLGMIMLDNGNKWEYRTQVFCKKKEIDNAGK